MKKQLFSNQASALQAANVLAKSINGTVELSSCDDIWNCECMDEGAEQLCEGGVSGETEAYRVYDQEFNTIAVMAYWEVDEEEANEEVEGKYESWIDAFQTACDKNGVNAMVVEAHSGYYRLFVDGELVYDDSACEDLYDELSAVSIFAEYVDSNYLNGERKVASVINQLCMNGVNF